MILANLTRAIRQQNWFAVAVEFLIVIAGVVIGFQIQGWAQNRELEARQAELLDRLHDEVEDTVEQLENMVSLYENVNAYRTEAIERLNARDFDGMDEASMINGLMSTSLFPAFSAREGVYNEIVNSGMLSQLGDTQFREALGDYRSSASFLMGQIDYLRDVINSRSRISQSDHVSQVYAPETSRQRRYIIDWESAADDPEFMEMLLTGNNSVRAISGWWNDTLEAAQVLCAETARMTERPCNAER